MAMEFGSPSAFARYLAEMEVRLHEAKHEGLKKASEMLVHEIRDEIGHYQGPVHGLPGWAELSERTQEERVKVGFTPDDPLHRTGGLAASYEYEVHEDHSTVGSPDPVAGWQENGTPDAKFPIPPRPVVGGSLFRRADDIVKAMTMPTIKVLEGKL